MKNKKEIIWLTVLAVSVCFTLVSSGIVLPDLSRPKKRLIATTAKAGQLMSAPSVILPLPRTNVVNWKFPSNINPTNYVWALQAKVSDGKTSYWMNIVYPYSGSVTVTATNPMTIFRLAGWRYGMQVP